MLHIYIYTHVCVSPRDGSFLFLVVMPLLLEGGRSSPSFPEGGRQASTIVAMKSLKHGYVVQHGASLMSCLRLQNPKILICSQGSNLGKGESATRTT